MTVRVRFAPRRDRLGRRRPRAHQFSGRGPEGLHHSADRPDADLQPRLVVDDVDMAITHVMRGDDHISNTPKQIALYRALGSPTPMFAHVPMINGPDGKKLSKRHGATAVGGERIIDEALFSAIVIMVIVTTMITPPALQWSLTRGERRRASSSP